MNRLQDFTFFSQLMANANMGWWKANLSTANYECSDFIVELLGLDQTGVISFEDFNKRIQKEEQLSTTVHSYGVYQRPEVVYLLDTVKGSVWVRSKVCFQETDEDGNEIVYGISEVQDGPDMASAYQALQYSERLLSNIFKYLPIGIELYDMDGVLVDLNDKELEMFHIEKKEDVLGINLFENPIFPKEMKERLKKNEDADFTFRYDFSKVGSYYQNTQKQGTIDLMTKVTTLYNSEHQPINYLLINADKTETTVAYNKIQEFEEFFELVGDYAKVGYAHFNILSGHGYAQKSWYRNVGEADETPLSDIFGTYRHFHPDDRALLIRFLDDARKGLTTQLSKEMRVLREDGTYTWTHVNLLVKKYAPQDRIIEIISINYDITELKRTEEMLVKARDKAEASDRLKSAFLANMSHEIRTPLNAIVGFSSLLTSTENAAEKELYNSLIGHNNKLLLNLINDVIDLSKIESGYLELRPDWVNLTELLDESVAEYVHQVPSGVELLTNYPAHDSLVELDRLRIKQILSNFLSNALKNTTTGHVEVFYEVDHQSVRIGVKDTGRGIPQNMLEKIFERFEKLDSFAQGAGLGLPICKLIVEKMNGRILVDSQLGIGTTFIIELPCRSMLVE
ncbi:PAS domain-containing sensor histidine kinase [Bacteroides xylanisolvens]|jgi:signal transduction histidine kinase|uniref:histidine kinase n=4 Tax=Bacteroides xylanisolvens TaxID=371601 RepID=A0A6I0ZAJ0_9BACE|nr:PAS domain-containing sensor histidine kinase [Bacteroides xylanisolvens]KAB6157878.1 PAS domain-containing sensor histidine kinase [Bacteroides xylanisolvens]KAB6171629.1 PAS domain-containing sensor histidine kinase [Bacteroides xylanisolvens]KAB6174075.1 PAS domain-containing sensor histidine kinase [Bacteroides xylanisolvens]KAB6183789.1 PAS domain-containing sensor histidine kinase [Bacteroides xylanisolvens]KAB6193791.1 PAS domain-containing sensor histidine kinase [Bacteroides xylani